MSESDEGNVLQKAEAKLAISAARKLADYAVKNLGMIIYTEEGEVRLPEVHEYLRAHITDPDLLTNADMAEALEQAGEKYMDTAYVGELINGIGNRWLRGGVNVGLGWAKKQLKKKPDFIQELREKKKTILLTFLKGDSTTYESFKLLEKRPKLTKFITEAVFVALEVPLEAPPPTPTPPGVQ